MYNQPFEWWISYTRKSSSLLKWAKKNSFPIYSQFNPNGVELFLTVISSFAIKYTKNTIKDVLLLIDAMLFSHTIVQGV